MAGFRQVALLLALCGVSYAADVQSGVCTLNVRVEYSDVEGTLPTPFCTETCTGLEDSSFTGTVTQRFDQLTSDFGVMVGVDYADGRMVDPCYLVSDPTYVPPPTCPEGFEYVGTSCYQVIPEVAKRDEQQSNCEAVGSSLAAIESQEEQDALAGWLTTSVFIALNDRLVTQGDYRNVAEVIPDFFSWNTGEPNKAYERCVVMKDNKGYKWNDVKCSKEFAGLCETPATPGVPVVLA